MSWEQRNQDSFEIRDGMLLILHILKERGSITNQEYQIIEQKIISGEKL